MEKPKLSVVFSELEVQALLIALEDSSNTYHTDPQVRGALQAFASRVDAAVKMQVPELKEFAQYRRGDF